MLKLSLKKQILKRGFGSLYIYSLFLFIFSYFHKRKLNNFLISSSEESKGEQVESNEPPSTSYRKLGEKPI